MKYTIEYEETIKAIHSITIEVVDNEEGEELADELYVRAQQFDHPDDIYYALEDMGVNIIDQCHGAETCTYEVL